MPPTEIQTPFGSVFWKALPVKDHLQKILRELSLASEMELSSADMVRTSEGRPEFPLCGFDANWSHSGDVCVLAYSFSAKVGVDIERIRPRKLRVAERFFADEEKARLFGKDLPGETSLREFYRLWCRKEAYFKCIGGEFFAGAVSRSMLPDRIGDVCLIDFNPKLEEPFTATIAVSSPADLAPMA